MHFFLPSTYVYLIRKDCKFLVHCDADCDGIVIGVPVTLSGSLRRRQTDSQQGRRCRNFADAVASLGASQNLPVFIVDERGTTVEAESIMYAMGERHVDVKARKDSVAAALILSVFYNEPAAAVKVTIPKVARRIHHRQENLQRESI